MDVKKGILKIFALLIVFLILISSCKSTKNTTEKSNKLVKEESSKPSKPTKISSKAEDFDRFYDKFHSDSVFQKSRIKFPLQGQEFNGNEKTKWTKENFGLLKVKIYDIDTTEYKVDYKKTRDEFTQKAWIDGSGYSSEYKFKLIDNKWFLVSVIELNI